jgi:hypothetical protein
VTFSLRVIGHVKLLRIVKAPLFQADPDCHGYSRQDRGKEDGYRDVGSLRSRQRRASLSSVATFDEIGGMRL